MTESGFEHVLWLHEMLIRQADPSAAGEALHPGRLTPPAHWQPRLSALVPYHQADPTELALSNYSAFDAIPDAALGAAIQQVTACEGPVHFAVLADRLLEAGGVKRLGRRIRAQIQKQVQVLHAAGQLRAENEWVAEPLQWLCPPYRDWRAAPDKTRQLEHVSDAELMLALFRAVFDDRLTDEESVMNTGLHNIGFIRLTERARDRLLTPLSRLYELELLDLKDGNVALGKQALTR